MMKSINDTSSSGHGVITAVVCLALAAVVAAMASLNVALPDIARDTHATQTQLLWVIDAYSLAFAALLLPGGALGDRYGRRVALVALVFSVIEAPTNGWLAARTVTGLALAVVLVIAFVIWEMRQRNPLLDPRVFRERTLTAGTMSILVQFFAFYGYTFIILQYLQLVRGATPLLAALEVLPLAATMMPTSRLAPRLAVRFGPRRVCSAGLILIAAGLAIVAQLESGSSYWLLAAGLVVLGVGMGAAMTPATTAITEALPPARQGVGSALNDLSREVGGAIGIAVIGSILTSTYSSRVNLTGLSGQVAAKVKGSFAVAAHLPAPIPDRAHAAFVTAMNIALLTAAGAAIIAAVGVVLLLTSRRRAARVPARLQPGSAISR